MTDNEKAKANAKRVSQCLERNYKQYKINVRKEQFYVWSKYAESKGLSVYAMIKEAIEKSIAADNFTPDVPYEESEK